MALALTAICGCILGTSLQSCSDEAMTNDKEQGGVENDTEAYYFSVDIQVPTVASATRSTTIDDEGNSSDGRIDATTKESTLKDAEIYFCQDNEVKVKLKAEQLVPRTDGTITLFAKLNDIDDLVDLALNKLTNPKVQLFVVGNVEETSLQHTFGKETGNVDANAATFTVDGINQAPIGDFGIDGQYIPIVNESEFTFTLKAGADKDATREAIKTMFQRGQSNYQYYVIPETLQMERGVARVEYKDIRPDEAKTDNKLSENIFKIKKLDEVYLQLYSLTPFNVNKKSYLFRHASSDGDNTKATGSSDLFKYERAKTSYGWITNPDWTATATNDGFTKNANFFNKITVGKDAYTIDNRTGEITIEELCKNGRTNGTGDGYHPWCYITENTVPSVDLMEDYVYSTDTETGDLIATPVVTDYATGVAFKFIVLDKNGDVLKYEDPNSEEDEETGIEKPAKESLYPKEVTNSVTEGAGEWITITDPETMKWVDVKPETITLGGKEITAYCLTYIACIIHNGEAFDAQNDEPIPPMYYGVVRNNTYQISINSIDYIPLPQDPRTIFLDLEVQVQEWLIRQNEWSF